VFRTTTGTIQVNIGHWLLITLKKSWQPWTWYYGSFIIFFFQALKFLHYIFLKFEVASKLSQRSRRKYVTGKIFCQSKIYSNFTIFCILTNVTVRSLRFIYTSVFRGRFHEFVEHN
jgi:hypothetical protein